MLLLIFLKRLHQGSQRKTYARYFVRRTLSAVSKSDLYQTQFPIPTRLVAKIFRKKVMGLCFLSVVGNLGNSIGLFGSVRIYIFVCILEGEIVVNGHVKEKRLLPGCSLNLVLGGLEHSGFGEDLRHHLHNQTEALISSEIIYFVQYTIKW